MKINVDTTVCLLHGQCVIAAPEVFSFGDDGALVWLAEVDGALADAAAGAADACPEQAIRLGD